MDTRVRASTQQFLIMLEYMENHGDLARPLTGPQGRMRSDRLWADLTNILNAVGGGGNKTADKWKKVWADWKSKTKKKASNLRQHASGTGGGPARHTMLSAIDERVLAIMGPLAVEGRADIEELGFNRPLPSNQLPPVPPVMTERDEENPVFLEIEYEASPPPSEAPPTASGSWLLPSTSQGPPQVPLVPDRPAAQAPAPATPAPPATPPPARRGATTPAPRRARSPTPATPRSAASPRRVRGRARRRHAPTPFERAAREFAAVEQRRLDLEETRARQQHEREMRALQLEHDRNELYRSLVNIAQSWFDFYRSRSDTEPLDPE